MYLPGNLLVFPLCFLPSRYYWTRKKMLWHLRLRQIKPDVDLMTTDKAENSRFSFFIDKLDQLNCLRSKQKFPFVVKLFDVSKFSSLFSLHEIQNLCFHHTHLCFVKIFVCEDIYHDIILPISWSKLIE